MERSQQILEIATLAAKALLESGAEIFRVQDTVCRIIEHYGVTDYNVYVIANGFFINIHEHEPDRRTAIRHVPLHGINIGQLVEVNQISREICADAYDMDEALCRLRAVQTPKPENKWLMTFASGVGAMGFCYLFRGTLADSAAAFVMGVILQLAMYWMGSRSKYLVFLMGAFLVTVCSVGVTQLFDGLHFSRVCIGAIIPLVPGVTFSTSVSELFNGDHVSGTIHLMDAILAAGCIAVGVGAAVFLIRMLGGAV